MSQFLKYAMEFSDELPQNPIHCSVDSPITRTNFFLSQHLEVEDKTGLNRKGNAYQHGRSVQEHNNLLLDKRERITSRYITLRSYLVNLFQEGLRFDAKSIRNFIDCGFDVIKCMEKVVESHDGVFGVERCFENGLTRLYDSEFTDIGFIKVTLAESLILFYTLDHKVELHEKKYPLFSREDRRSLDKLRDIVIRVSEKIKLGRHGPTYHDFMRKMIPLEDKWLVWKNRKCVDTVFKRPPTQLAKRGVIRRLCTVCRN